MLATVSLLVWSVLLPSPELAFSGLPANGNGAAYSLTIKVKLADKKVVPIKIDIGARAEPQDVLDTLCDVFGDEEWDIRTKGLSVMVAGFDGRPVVHVEIESTGPAPTLRWVPRGSLKR